MESWAGALLASRIQRHAGRLNTIHTKPSSKILSATPREHRSSPFSQAEISPKDLCLSTSNERASVLPTVAHNSPEVNSIQFEGAGESLFIEPTVLPPPRYPTRRPHSDRKSYESTTVTFHSLKDENVPGDPNEQLGAATQRPLPVPNKYNKIQVCGNERQIMELGCCSPYSHVGLKNEEIHTSARDGDGT